MKEILLSKPLTVALLNVLAILFNNSVDEQADQYLNGAVELLGENQPDQEYADKAEALITSAVKTSI